MPTGYRWKESNTTPLKPVGVEWPTTDSLHS